MDLGLAAAPEAGKARAADRRPRARGLRLADRARVGRTLWQ
jgi:hypothetical protein